jgi:TP901 family phage tail tape measure protein
MGIQEAGAELAEMFNFVDEIMPLTVEIENARVQFEKFVDNIDEAKALEDQLQDIGLAFGFAADEAFEAGARMAQLSGVLGGQGSTAVGTEMGMMFGAISGMTTEAAMQRLINLNQQTKFMTKNIEEGMTAQEKSNIIRRDTIRVLDQLNTVENRSAATMSQITFVMNQFASQAYLTNESIAAMAAMSATLIEAGEEQGKGGRALRMIYARLGADTNGARTTIENLGIAVVDANGDMRPFSRVLQDLAVHYNTLNGEQKMALAQSIAGNRHYTRLIKLLENVDRVRELELEALLAQFPARDELQRRLNSEVFAYEQAEASLKNYSAAFGNTLLPAMTAVTKQQALFYRTLAGAAEGPLGTAIGSIVMLTRLMSNFIGPAMNASVSFINLKVAMETQNIVARALRGEQIAGNASMQQSAIQHGILIQYKHELRTVMEAQNNVTSVEANILRQSVQDRIQLINTLAMEDTTRAAHIRWLKVDMEALRLLGIEIDVFTNKEMKAIQVENMMGNTMLQSGMRATQYSMKIGGLGAAFMMFSKSERMMRIGMMLTTTAMAIQMFQVYKSMAAMAAKRREEMLAAGTAEIHTWAMVRQAAATKIVSAATLKAAASFFLLDKAIVAVASRVVVLLVAFFLIEKLMNKIGLFEMPDMTMAEDMGGQIADTGLIIEYMAMETTALNTILEDNATMVAAIGDKTDSTTARIVQAKEAENLAIYEVLQARRLEILSLEDAEKAVNDYIVAQDLLNQIKKEGKYEAEGEGPEGYGFLGLGDEMLWIYNNISKPLGFPKNSIINWMTGGLIEDQEEATKIVEDFAIDFVDLHDWMGDTVFDNWEDAAFALQEYVDAFAGVTADELSGGIVGSLTTTTDALYKFNNAREEMFFGFSSDRLTGDLVRQVHQQGVETLITSTEVIMHNNFNGMTTEEVAEEIIGFIETGGNFANYNIGSYGG